MPRPDATHSHGRYFLPRGSRACLALAMLIVVSAPISAESPDLTPTPLAIADFDYWDTSGEPGDQAAEHKLLVETFLHTLRNDLDRSGKYRVVALGCKPGSCSPSEADPAALLDDAHRVGARLLLLGSIHKVSTLIQEGRITAVDVKDNKVVFQRALSFRGDDERAWLHAEAFLARDLEAQDFTR